VSFVSDVVSVSVLFILDCPFCLQQKGQSRMNNTETLATSDTQDTGQSKHQKKQKGQSTMNNTETPATSDTQETGQNDVASVSVLFILDCPFCLL
jgi:hypothetical protein